MNNWLVILVSTSTCGTIIFSLLLFIRYGLPNDYLDFVYKLMKIIGLFFLWPVLAISYYVINANSISYKIYLKSEDFSYIQQVAGLKKLDLVLDGSRINIVGVIVIIWCIVFIFTYMAGITQELLFLNKIMKGVFICNSSQQSMLDTLKEEMKITKKIKLYQSDAIYSPLLIGIFYPKIILPNMILDDEDQRLLLKHELTHYRNHDLLFRSLFYLIQKFHWFNPFIYVYTKIFFETGELVCDQLTMEMGNQQQRAKYANLLVSLAEKAPHNKIIASFSDNNYKVLERRIRNIMRKFNSQKNHVMFLITVLLLLSYPIVSYSSTWEVVNLQDKLVMCIEEKNGLECFSHTFLEETIGISEMNTDYEYIGDLSQGGSSSIDYVLSASGEPYYSSVDLNVGSKVKIALSSDNSSDKYRVGIIDENNKRRYVTTNNGMVSKEFNITAAGAYTIYFEGKISNGRSIHLTGVINIEY